MAHKDAVGRYGEDVAAGHLAADGMRLVARNWRCPHGEIDVVAVDGGCLVVCEVKTRSSVSTGAPVEAVTPAKLARLRQLAGIWLEQSEEWFDTVRIDVVSVLRSGPGRCVAVEHLRGVE